MKDEELTTGKGKKVSSPPPMFDKAFCSDSTLFGESENSAGLFLDHIMKDNWQKGSVCACALR